MKAWDITHKLFYNTNKIIKIKNCQNQIFLNILLKGTRANIFAPPPKHFKGGGQEKCVLYTNNKKLTLPTGYSVSQMCYLIWNKKEIYSC